MAIITEYYKTCEGCAVGLYEKFTGTFLTAETGVFAKKGQI